MIHNPNMYRTMSLGVVLRKTPGVTRWAPWAWKASAVLPGAGPADWAELRREGDTVEYHAGTSIMELHGAETEAYLHGITAEVPCVYVVMRATDDAERPFDIVVVTASPYEAQDYCDSGEEVVERVAMPQGVLAWVWEFVDAFHEEEEFVKRRRDKKRIDRVEEGIGDARIAQIADVYRAPSSTKRRLQ